MSTVNQPRRCPMCGCAFTMDSQFSDDCCTDPGHWQAAGLLSSHDYYPMAIITARANLILNRPTPQPETFSHTTSPTS